MEFPRYATRSPRSNFRNDCCPQAPPLASFHHAIQRSREGVFTPGREPLRDACPSSVCWLRRLCLCTACDRVLAALKTPGSLGVLELAIFLSRRHCASNRWSVQHFRLAMYPASASSHLCTIYGAPSERALEHSQEAHTAKTAAGLGDCSGSEGSVLSVMDGWSHASVLRCWVGAACFQDLKTKMHKMIECRTEIASTRRYMVAWWSLLSRGAHG